jgi:hypothetical protein
MNLPDLTSALDAAGVKLGFRPAVDDPAGFKLKVDAPSGALTPELRAALVEHRVSLLVALAGKAESATPPAPGPSPWPPRPTQLHAGHWPHEWRERWGRRANLLQNEGVPWPEYERLAFLETRAAMEVAS